MINMHREKDTETDRARVKVQMINIQRESGRVSIELDRSRNRVCVLIRAKEKMVGTSYTNSIDREQIKVLQWEKDR